MVTLVIGTDRNGCFSFMDVDDEDALAVATPVAGFNNDSEEKNVFISKTIRFYFAAMDQHRIDCTSLSEVHSEWICIVQSAFGTNLKIINNSNSTVTRIDNTSSKQHGAFSHAQHFQIHSKLVGRTQTGAPKKVNVIVHRIQTRVPFSQMKHPPTALQWLQTHQCYLNEHLVWDEQTWDFHHQIGLFVTGFHPMYCTTERARDVFRARNCRAAPRAKVPKFQFFLNAQRIIFNDRQSNTQPFSVKVPSHQSPQLIETLKAVTQTRRAAFASSRMRSKNPEAAYHGAIRC